MVIEVLNGIIQNVFRILAASWWIVLPFVLWLIFLEFWLMAVRWAYIQKIKWKLLEVKIPKEILKTPKAMELVFAAVHSTYSGGIKFWDKWWKGEVEMWTAFEIVGSAGGIHFYIRVAGKYRNMMESAIYAQYPDAEIIEIDDYTDLLPSILPNKIYDLWGTNFLLARASPYPVRTYEYFEERVKEKRLDPMAMITETMSRTKEDEMIWLQILISPISDKLKKEGEKLVAQLIGRKTKEERTILEDLGIFIKNLIFAPFTHPVWSEDEKEGSAGDIQPMTPGEKDVVTGIENKISKLSFETVIRFIYIDKADAFTQSNISGVLGAFRQFSTLHLNGFKLDKATITKVNFPFKARKLYVRKRRLYDSYRLRFFPIFSLTKNLLTKNLPILNIEELATIYHFPTTFVEAPTLKRLESRRGEPPAELPIVE